MKEKLEQLKRNPLGLAVWCLLVCGGYLLLGSGAYQAQTTVAQRLPWALLALAFVLIGHELLHALAARLLCGSGVSVRIAKDPVGLPSLCTVYPANVSRGRRLVILLTPLAALTVLPTLVIALGQPVFFLFLTAMINLVGAYFDLVDTALLLSDVRR